MSEKLEWCDTKTEITPESFCMIIRTQVVLTLLKDDSSRELLKKMVSGDESIRKDVIKIIIMKHFNNSSDGEIDAMIEDINHTRERSDGSSDGLKESLDIINNNFRECSNWNLNLHQIWTLSQLFPVGTALSPDDEIKLFNTIWEAKFPGKTNLTWKEQIEVYKSMKEFLEEIKDLIKKLI